MVSCELTGISVGGTEIREIASEAVQLPDLKRRLGFFCGWLTAADQRHY